MQLQIPGNSRYFSAGWTEIIFNVTNGPYCAFSVFGSFLHTKDYLEEDKLL